MRRATDILSQIEKAGLMPYLADTDPLGNDSAVTGRMRTDVLAALRADPRFASGAFYQLHRDVGADLTEFRAHPGEIGYGSLQIVIDTTTGRFYADIDRFSPYTDLVNIVGHAVGEVLPGWLKRIGRVFRRRTPRRAPTTAAGRHDVSGFCGGSDEG